MKSLLFHNIEKNIRFYLSLYPILFYPLFFLRNSNRELAVTRATDIVIEGFPRSANSFSVGAFQSSQSSSASVANHLHAAAQIIRARQLGIPAILLIRSPVSAVLSLRSLNFQTVEKRGSYHPVLDANIKTYLIQWIRFYTQVKPFHSDYIIGAFDEVTSDFGAVVDRVNRRFSTSFELFDHTPDNVKTVHEIQGYHAGPSSRRQDFKQRAKQELKAANCEALIAEANALYQEFVELAHQQTLALSQQSPQSP